MGDLLEPAGGTGRVHVSDELCGMGLLITLDPFEVDFWLRRTLEQPYPSLYFWSIAFTTVIIGGTQLVVLPFLWSYPAPPFLFFKKKGVAC